MTPKLDKSGGAYEDLTWGKIALYLIGYYPAKSIAAYARDPNDARKEEQAKSSAIYLVGSTVASSLFFGFMSSKVFHKPFKEAVLYSIGSSVALNAVFFAYGLYDVANEKK